MSKEINYYLLNNRYYSSKRKAQKVALELKIDPDDIEIFDEIEYHYGESFHADGQIISREEMLDIAETWSTALGYGKFVDDKGKPKALRPILTDNITKLPYRLGDEFIIEGYDGNPDGYKDMVLNATQMTCARQRYGVSNESLYEFYKFFKASENYLNVLLDIDWRICQSHNLPYKVSACRTEDIECPWCRRHHKGAKKNTDGLMSADAIKSPRKRTWEVVDDYEEAQDAFLGYDVEDEFYF